MSGHRFGPPDVTPGYTAGAADFGGGASYSPGPAPRTMFTSAARVPLRVSYLTSTAHSASNTVLHFYQSAEPHRVAVGAPARRVVALVDEDGYRRDFEPLIHRCIGFSRVEEIMLLPEHARGILASVGPNPGATGTGAGTAATLTDVDVLLQQSSPLDFIRTIGALFRPRMSGGTPPLFQLDEGQPLAARVNCHLRDKPLRDAIVDGVSREALRQISEDHTRQLQAMRNRLSEGNQIHASELVDLYAERDQLKAAVSKLQSELLAAQRHAREDRDHNRTGYAELKEDLRRAREEITLLKLLRHGALPEDHPLRVGESGPGWVQPTRGGGGASMSATSPMAGAAGGGTGVGLAPGAAIPPAMSGALTSGNVSWGAPASPPPNVGMDALARLRRDIESGEQFLAKLRRSPDR